jgi:acyl-coenzyme A synthetase/AMP-(fatty) acid ligase
LITEPDFRLVERPGNAVLFHRGEVAIDAAMFLRHCHALAATLPAHGHMINQCRDRYAFAVSFAASVLRGTTCLLTGDRSAAGLGMLAETYKDSYLATDEPDAARDAATTAGLPVHLADTRTGGSGAAQSGDPPNPVIPADQLAAIVFTSGSTGAPTPHRKSWGALAERSRAAATQFGLTMEDPIAVVGTVPPQHMYGFETTVLLPLHAPASSWCGAAFYPTDVQAALEAVPAPRLLVTTPLQMGGLLRAAVRLPALHAIISATAPLEADLAAAAEARWHTQVLEIFGATEVGSIASRRTVEGDRWTLYPEVRLVPDDAATNAGDEMVAVTGPFAPQVPLADNVERLGDTQFRLVGRRTDIVKLGGHRASLAGLNRVLLGLEGVADGSFVVPDNLDQQPTARLMAVVVAPERSASSILRDLRLRLDALFVPRRVILVPTLPRNEVGKLSREALLRLVAQDPTASEA